MSDSPIRTRLERFEDRQAAHGERLAAVETAVREGFENVYRRLEREANSADSVLAELRGWKEDQAKRQETQAQKCAEHHARMSDSEKALDGHLDAERAAKAAAEAERLANPPLLVRAGRKLVDESARLIAYGVLIFVLTAALRWDIVKALLDSLGG